MKKTGILCMMGVLLFVGACGSSKSASKKITCVHEMKESGIKHEVTISYGKEVEKISLNTESSIPDYMFEREKDIKKVEKLFKDQYVNPNIKQKGITYDISVDKKKKKLFVEIEVDAKTVTAGEASTLGIVELKDVEKIKKGFEATGFTCK